MKMTLRAQKYVGSATRLYRRLCGRDWKAHPIDKLYGIETSAKVSRLELWTGSPLDSGNIGYAGVQPSILRTCLDLLPITRDWAFVDLGCGKGRALAVASEYPFGLIRGIELSQLVHAIATKNSKALSGKLGVTLQLELGDATAFEVPNRSDIVLFLYNSFVEEALFERTMARIEHHLKANPDLKFFLIYYNPVFHQVFDNSPILSRLFAKKIDFAEEERAVAPMTNTYDSVIVYQSNNRDLIVRTPSADAAVSITIPLYGADVLD